MWRKLLACRAGTRIEPGQSNWGLRGLTADVALLTGLSGTSPRHAARKAG